MKNILYRTLTAVFSCLNTAWSLEITYNNTTINCNNIEMHMGLNILGWPGFPPAGISLDQRLNAYRNDIRLIYSIAKSDWQSIHPHWGIGKEETSLTQSFEKINSYPINTGMSQKKTDYGIVHSRITPSRLSLFLTTHPVNYKGTVLKDCSNSISVASIYDIQNPNSKFYIPYSYTILSNIMVPCKLIQGNILQNSTLLFNITTPHPCLQFKLDSVDTKKPCFVITPNNEVKLVGYYYFKDASSVEVDPIAYPDTKAKLDYTFLQTAIEGTGKPDLIKSVEEKAKELKISLIQTKSIFWNKNHILQGTPVSPHTYIFKKNLDLNSLTDIPINNILTSIKKKEDFSNFSLIHVQPQDTRVIVLKKPASSTQPTFIDANKKINEFAKYPYEGTPIYNEDFMFANDLYCSGLGYENYSCSNFKKEDIAQIHYSVLAQAIEMQ